MPRFRRQYEQLSQFERGRINDLREIGWSARRVASQLGRSDCVLRFVGTSGPERCHLHEDQVQDALDRPVVEKTATLRLTEGHLGSRSPLRMLPLTPTHRRLRLEWCRARGNGTATEWNQVVFSDESRFNLSSDDNRVRVGRPRGESVPQSCLCCTATHRSHSWCDELYKVFKEADVIETIKTDRLRFGGHICRMDPSSLTFRIFNYKSIGTKTKGRPKLRWADCVEDGFKVLLLLMPPNFVDLDNIKSRFTKFIAVRCKNFTSVVNLSFEYHAGDRTILLGSSPIFREQPGSLPGCSGRTKSEVSHLSSPSTKLTKGLEARRLFRVPPVVKALYIYKHPCLLRDSNPGPTAFQLASLTTIPDGEPLLSGDRNGRGFFRRPCPHRVVVSIEEEYFLIIKKYPYINK
ncbi:transposable element Tcb1 transposase [Trichonephila clavipes]|nr:transposable element Tcb1 transposase [Trichonephila clavipes]